jgi:hypothetical protein
MTSDGPPVERLRAYLRTLSPAARTLLIAELERGLLRGEDVAGAELVLEELRRSIRAAGQPMPRLGEPARLFFAPLEPFLIDDAADHKRLGRLARVSLAPVWEWIGRDLIPVEAKALSADINRALSDDNRIKAEQLTRALHERAILRIKEALAAVHDGDKARRRLAVQLGTPRALEDLTTLVGILANRDALADLARRLPNNIRAFEREQIELVKGLLEGVTVPKMPASAAADKADFLLYGLILVVDRLAARWQLIRLATRAAGSDDITRIVETPFAVAVTVVLSEVEAMVSDLRTELKARRPLTSILKAIHDAARGLHTELDLSVDSPWSRQLAALRTGVSNVLKAEIESTPGRVRRLLQPRPAKEIAPSSRLDAREVSEIEMLVEFVGACRNYANELAVNEVTMRSYSELERYLETGTKILLDALRHAGDADRPFRQSQMEAAIRCCRIVFGADYAGLLTKATEMAVQTPTVERKQVRAR